MSRKIFLVKYYKTHTQHLYIRFKHRPPEKFIKLFQLLVHSFTFLIQDKSPFSKFFTLYSSATLGIMITLYGLKKLGQVFVNATRISRLMRLRFVALPCFLDTAMPIFRLFDGKYNNVIQGENTLFPLLKIF